MDPTLPNENPTLPLPPLDLVLLATIGERDFSENRRIPLIFQVM